MLYQRFSEDRSLTYLVSQQLVALCRAWGHITLGVRLAVDWNGVARPSAVFWRDWGVVIFLAPALWLVAAIALRRRAHDRYLTDQLVFWSGIAFAALIVLWSVQVAMTARGSTLIQVTE